MNNVRKILWVMSRPLSGSFGFQTNNFSGSWLDAAFASCSVYENLELHIVSVGNVPKMAVECRGRHVLYLLPGGGKKYDERDVTNIQSWLEFKKIINPDLIQIWGTECDFAKIALKTFPDVPSIIYIQGVMDAVARGYDAGLSFKTKLKILTPFDVIHKNWINASQNKYYQRANREREILNMATAAIVENDWCEDQIHKIAPQCICYRSNLPIKDVFWNTKWDFEQIEPYSIFTNAGSMPLKGHHYLFKALGIVKNSYPDFKLYIPGIPLKIEAIGRNFHTPGYSFLLAKLIKKYSLENNIHYVGLLSDFQMANYLSKVNLFVMPSCVENHSSSLIEALLVGTPCVTTFVGGTGNVVKDGVNAILYNSHDYASLGGSICRVFESKELAKRLSYGANEYRMKRKHNVGDDMKNIYDLLLQNKP